MPKLVEFLGYDPFHATATTVGDLIKEYRRINGLSLKKLARNLAINPATLARCEKTGSIPSKKLELILRQVLSTRQT